MLEGDCSVRGPVAHTDHCSAPCYDGPKGGTHFGRKTSIQDGYRFVFAGGVKAIRNPRGHEHSVVDDPDICLDHLSFVSLLLRRLEQAGYK